MKTTRVTDYAQFLRSSGVKIPDICRKLGVSQAWVYRKTSNVKEPAVTKRDVILLLVSIIFKLAQNANAHIDEIETFQAFVSPISKIASTIRNLTEVTETTEILDRDEILVQMITEAARSETPEEVLIWLQEKYDRNKEAL